MAREQATLHCQFLVALFYSADVRSRRVLEMARGGNKDLVEG